MNAYELADELEKVVFQSTYPLLFDKSADMLRQQADRTAKLESYLEAYKTRVVELEKLLKKANEK